ncbi:NAD-P-binding protein [Artomyces pyxidatus]|uniref:NAD-P-binding protein n=1 Tax=Artomyces pyxidatus TaxID=48021 RepID=A0ACB8TFM6_9AGAM|nr:NAD-P-binding protein [Artomyces pyxidatus]
MTSWTNKTTAQEAALALQNEIKGKNVLVTGVSPRSLGAETVRVLAPYANTIILASRNRSRTEETIAAVKAETPSASLEFVTLDLTSIESIKKAAAEVNSLGIPIHVVINNAAVSQFETLSRTVDGFEAQIGANHLGHFLFNSLILPSVRSAAKERVQPRIVVVSSLAVVYEGELRFDDFSYEKNPGEYAKLPAYSKSKTANILYARALAKKLAKENILVFSLHPGAILETNMGSAASEDQLKQFGLLDEHGKPVRDDTFKTIEEGTSTQIIAAFEPLIKDKSGAFLSDGQIADDLLPVYATDEASEVRLWELSEQLLGHKFTS